MSNLISSPSRLEAFSDGVIAVIITIMVLEFKVPHADGMAGFVTILPTLAVYLLSFAFTGIYWVNHHHAINRLRHVDPLILWANLLFLFCLSLLPFFTNYLVEKHLNPFSVSLYSASLFVTGVGFTCLTMSITRHLRRSAAAEDRIEAERQAVEQIKGVVSLALYLTSVLLASRHPYLALALVSLVTLIWIIPTFGVQHHNQSLRSSLEPQPDTQPYNRER